MVVQVLRLRDERLRSECLPRPAVLLFSEEAHTLRKLAVLGSEVLHVERELPGKGFDLRQIPFQHLPGFGSVGDFLGIPFEDSAKLGELVRIGAHFFVCHW